MQITSFLSTLQRKLLEPEEETEEEKQFRAIYEQIAGEVSTQRGAFERDNEDNAGQAWMSEYNIGANYSANCSSLPQDMQICANELKMIMKNVLAKREHTGKICSVIVCAMC